jgi:dolichyl-phosphate beta-glucosyltransferase
MPETYLSIVVPAYNESQRITASLERICHYAKSKPLPVEVVLVDDGSTDTTAEIMLEYEKRHPFVRALRHKPNRGKGYTVREGVLAAQGEFVLFTDADLSAPIQEADKLLAAIESSGADAAIGSRALERNLIGVHQPWFREVAGRSFNRMARLMTGLRLRDTQCGLKLFRRGSTRRAFELMRTEGFGFDPELLFLIVRLKGNVLEIPVHWNDHPATKVRFWHDSSRMFLDLIGIRWRALTGAYSAPPR